MLQTISRTNQYWSSYWAIRISFLLKEIMGTLVWFKLYKTDNLTIYKSDTYTTEPCSPSINLLINAIMLSNH